MVWNAKNQKTEDINCYLDSVKQAEVINVLGQRYLGNAKRAGNYIIHGYVGNAFCSFLDGAQFELYGNAQEACGTTMSSGRIIIHGHCGDALAYGMRGGEILIAGSCGSRCGVHMKRYRQQKSILVIGETAGDFLGEYNSGGIILVLNQKKSLHPVGRFCGVGAHDGAIFIRMPTRNQKIGLQEVEKNQMKEIYQLIDHYAKVMKTDAQPLKEGYFYQVTLETKNPYEKLYIND